MSAIDEIKARIDIVDLVSESVQLRHSGKNYLGFCPFHPNTRTPAFAVFPESGTWRCFGQCNEGGDIFRFVMKKENCEFPEALRILADKAGIVLKPPTPEERVMVEENDALRSLMEEAATFYRHQLLNTPAGKETLTYLHQRKITDDAIEAFGLGYAPNAWEALIEHFISHGHTQQDLLDCGLVTEREGGGFYDRFRHRLMFPIRDEQGRMAGFGGRILNPQDIPKFINTPQTAIFDKGHLLYGLDRSRKSIRSQDQAVIVEGYLDVIALHQAGYTNTVSPMGTALTDQQLYLLKRFSHRIVLALDPDAAGIQATLRGLEIARQTMDRAQDPVFDARGLLGYEARLQADIRVTTLPQGMDPDDVVNQDPTQWESILSNAQPIVIHVMNTLAATQDTDDPKIKNDIASRVIPLIQDVPNPVERDTYLQKLSRLLRIDERTLLGWLPAQSRRRPTRRFIPDRSSQKADRSITISKVSASSITQEAYALGVLLRRPELLYQVDRNLQKYGLPRLSADDFQHTDHQAIITLLIESIDQDAAEPLNFVMNHLSLSMMEVADALLMGTEKLDPNEEKIADDIKRIVLSLRQRNVHQAIEYQRFLMEDAHQQGDIKGTQYQKNMVQLTSIKAKIDRALGKHS